MGVLGLHNECPPLTVGPETPDICRGMAVGEAATSATLLALSDCLQCLAAMDDTVGGLVSMWSAAITSELPPPAAMPTNGGPPSMPLPESYRQSFAALQDTVTKVDVALDRYFNLNDYALKAAAAGRGVGFQRALQDACGSDFDTLVRRRVEYLRKLKVRVRILQQTEDHGAEVLQKFDFPEFFLMFMQPLRDLALAVQDLYNEVLRGALGSHQALFRACRLLGEGAEETQELPDVPESIHA